MEERKLKRESGRKEEREGGEGGGERKRERDFLLIYFGM